jgi:hypothetical protein
LEEKKKGYLVGEAVHVHMEDLLLDGFVPGEVFGVVEGSVVVRIRVEPHPLAVRA